MAMMLIKVAFALIYFQLVSMVVQVSSEACPEMCVCHSTVVDCAGQGLSQIPAIPPETTALHFAGNHIPDISRDTFPNLPQLADLDLSSCDIRDIKPLTFAVLPSLRSLKLSFNSIFFLPPLVLGSLRLISLDLEHNPLQLISSRAFENTTSERFNLNDCNLQTLPVNVFDDTKDDLSVFHLSNNKRKLELPKGIFDGVFLTELYLNNNGLENMDCVFGLSADVVEANMNKLGDSIWEAIGHMTFIKEGHFVENMISYVNLTVSVHSLTYLSLEDNTIQVLNADSFENIPNLYTLNLHNNSISQIPADFDAYLTNLSVLDLGANKISALPYTSLDNTILTYLDLSANKFEVIQEETIELFDLIRTVVLYDNPLRCNCRMVNMWEWAKALTYEDTQLWGAECFTPTKVPISNLRREQLTCDAPSITTFATMGGAAELGSGIAIQCSAHGEPPPALEIVTPSGGSHRTIPHTGSTSGLTSVMFNTTVTCDDVGEYVCSATNSEGTVLAGLRLGQGDALLRLCSTNQTTNATTVLTTISGTPLVNGTVPATWSNTTLVTSSTIPTVDSSVSSVKTSTSTTPSNATDLPMLNDSTTMMSNLTNISPLTDSPYNFSTGQQNSTQGGATNTPKITIEHPSGTTHIPTLPNTSTTELPTWHLVQHSPTTVQKFAIIFGVIVLIVFLIMLTAKLIYWSKTANKAYHVTTDPSKMTYDNPITDTEKVI